MLYISRQGCSSLSLEALNPALPGIRGDAYSFPLFCKDSTFFPLYSAHLEIFQPFCDKHFSGHVSKAYKLEEGSRVSPSGTDKSLGLQTAHTCPFASVPVISIRVD